MNTYDKILDFIIESKNNQNLTTVKLADMIGASRQGLQRYFEGVAKMPAEIMFNCLEALGHPIVIESYEKVVEGKRIVL